MSELKKIGYWRVSKELSWAVLKALMVVTIISFIRFGFVLNGTELSNGLFDAFGGAALMHLMGLILYVPIMFVLVLIIASPVAKFLINKYDNNRCFLILGGAATSLLVFKGLMILLSDDPLTLNTLLRGNFDLVLGGLLSGFFLHRQLDKDTPPVS